MAVLLFGVANRVFYRMALVPMHDHIFVLAQFQNIAYVGIYFGILLMRCQAGKVGQLPAH